MNKRALLIGGAVIIGAYVVTINVAAARPAQVISGGASGGTVKAQAANFIAQIDARDYGGFFARNGVIDHKDILALFQIESNFDPDAINYNDGGQGNHAYGLGQMLGTTARDMGYSGSSLFVVENAVEATMKYLRFIYNYLTPRMSVVGKPQWIGAYNMGIGNVARGRLPVAYLAKHTAARLALIG